MKHIIIILSLLFFSVHLGAQVSFTATVDAKQIVQNSTVNITFKLENAKGKGFTPPKFQGLELVGGPSTSQSTQIINGRSSSSVSYTYSLLGIKVGKYTIKPARIQANNKPLRTKPIVIEVVKGKAANSLSAADKNNFVRIEVNDSTAVVGQQVVLEYVPQRTGIYEIDPVIVDLAIPIPGQKPRGIFGRTPTRKKRISTNKLTINVENLPKPEPEFFSGAVGRYQMSSQTPKTNVTTDEAILVTMDIVGNGDGKTFSAPALPPMDGLEYYEPNILKDEDITQVGGIYNKKSIEYLIVPKQIGSYIIRPEFTYYNTDSNSYQTIFGRKARVKVTQGDRSITEDDRDIALGGELAPKKMQSATISGHMSRYAHWPLYGGFGVFAMGLIGIFIKKRQLEIEAGIDPEERRRRQAKEMAVKQLAKAKSFMQSDGKRAFYTEVSAAMNGFLGDKYQIPNTDLDKLKVKKHLEDRNVDPLYITRYIELLTKSEMAIFAGQAAGDMKSIYDESISLIQDLADV